MGRGEADHEHEFAVRITHGCGIRAALVQLPDAGENVGVDGSLGDQPFRAESQFVKPAESSAGLKTRRIGGLAASRARASDEVARFLLDVAEIGERPASSISRSTAGIGPLYAIPPVVWMKTGRFVTEARACQYCANRFRFPESGGREMIAGGASSRHVRQT